MRVSPAELQAVERAGMLTRYALFGPVAFVLVDLPRGGTAGTGLDEPCLTDHHGIVMRGTFIVDHEDGRSDSFAAGTAFYVPHGPPSHSFRSKDRTVVGGFAPLAGPVDTSAEGLDALGFRAIERPALPAAPPVTVQPVGGTAPFRREGEVSVEGTAMGDWIFMRSTFGPKTGHTGGSCDLPHWGLVLDGEIAITYDREVELATRGDAFYAPPGHRFASADGATVVDYTPSSSLGAKRVANWRRAALDLPVATTATAGAAVTAVRPAAPDRRLLRPPLLLPG